MNVRLVRFLLQCSLISKSIIFPKRVFEGSESFYSKSLNIGYGLSGGDKFLDYLDPVSRTDYIGTVFIHSALAAKEIKVAHY